MNLFGNGLRYKKINNINRDIYVESLKNTFDIIPSDMFPSVLLGHGSILDIRYAYNNGIFHIKDIFNRETVYYPTVGNVPDCMAAIEKFHKKGDVFTAIPEDMKTALSDYFGDKISFSEEPWLFDYIIDNKDLSECSGVRYKSIRQAVNRFFENTKASVKDIKNCNLSDIHKLNEQALSDMNKKSPNNTGIEHERLLFEYLLEMLHEDNNTLFGTVILKDDIPVAFTINERISNTSAGVYAKCNHSYKDIGPALAVSDARNQVSMGIKYCNLMADEGEPGLKENKTLLRPCMILKKYRAVLL